MSGYPSKSKGSGVIRIVYDQEVDALSIIFRDTTVTTEDWPKGITAEYDADGQLAGIEILDATQRFGGEETLRHVMLEGVGPVLRK